MKNNPKSIDIHLAVRNGDVESVQSFLANGGSARLKDRYDCEPVIYAIKHNQIEIAKLLLEEGGTMDCYSILRASPITIAVWNLNIELVKFVVNNGADINRIEKDETPLDILHKMKSYVLPNRDNTKLKEKMKQLLIDLGGKTSNETKVDKVN